MLPAIGHVLAVEMLRDGGSLNASFLGLNGSNYSLLFEIKLEASASGVWMRLGYQQPRVFERQKFRRPNGGHEWEAFNEVEVSWKHAEVLLHQMQPHLRSDLDLQWHETMLLVASAQGALPADIASKLGMTSGEPARPLD